MDEACNRLVKYATDEVDRRAVEKEINELKMALDLMTSSDAGSSALAAT